MKINKLALVVLLPLAIGSGSANALEAKCEYIDKTVVKTTGIIEATRNYERATTHYAEEKRVCAVKIDVKIDKNWQETKGFYIFGPDMSENKACEKAEDRAKLNALEQHAPQEIESEIEHVCDETIEVKKEEPIEVIPNPGNNNSRVVEDRSVVIKDRSNQVYVDKNAAVNPNDPVIWRNGVCWVKDTTFHPECNLYTSNALPKVYSRNHQNNMNLLSLFNWAQLIVGQITRR